jgi:hypothetical protein
VGDVNKYDTATKLYLVVYDDEEEHYVTVREVLKILYVPQKNMTTDSENVSEDEWDNKNNINDNSRNNDSRNKKGGNNSGRNNNDDKKGGNNSGRNNDDNKSNNEYIKVKKGGKISKSSHDIDESDNDDNSMISKNKNKKQKLSPQDQAVRNLLELSKEFENNQMNRERELLEEKIEDDKECKQKKIRMKLFI